MKIDARPLFLVGFMGSGKSETGRRLAKLTDREFLDTDGLVSVRERKSIAAIFADSGEEQFRAVEWEMLQLLAGRKQAIVATGGGLFLRHAARAWLRRQGKTVWLDAPLDVVRQRLREQPDRPLWPPDDPVAQRILFEGRRAAYALADLRVDASSGDPGEMARRVLKRLIRISG